MKLNQNDFETIKDRLDRGLITADQANVEMVLARRIVLVTSRLPANIRGAYNAAVKAGELGHVKKDGHKPEAYFHPTFQYLVAGERNAYAASVLRAVASVMG